MTELTVLHCAVVGQDYVEKPKSCGAPVPVCDIKIVDQETRREVPAGTVGTILARGPNIMKRYVGNESEYGTLVVADLSLPSVVPFSM